MAGQLARDGPVDEWPVTGRAGRWFAHWGRPMAFGLSALGLLLALYLGHIAAGDGFAYDAHAYWLADGYERPVDTADAFVYSPPVLLVSRVLHQLPWPVFLEGYSMAIAVGIWVLAGPWTLLVIWTPQVASELTLGNVHVFLALVAVYGLRWPGLWAFALLTKVTPGVGLLWFVVRREWRHLAVALGVTAAIAIPTMILTPDLWAGWLGILAAGQDARPDGVPLLIRFPLAAALVVVGARKGWPVVLPVASMLALPILWDVHGLSMLLGVLAVARRSGRPGLRFMPSCGSSPRGASRCRRAIRIH